MRFTTILFCSLLLNPWIRSASANPASAVASIEKAFCDEVSTRMFFPSAAASCPSWSKSWALRVAPFRMKSRYRSDCAPVVLVGCAPAMLAAASSRNHNGGRGWTDRVKFDVRCFGTVKLCGGLFFFEDQTLRKLNHSPLCQYLMNNPPERIHLDTPQQTEIV